VVVADGVPLTTMILSLWKKSVRPAIIVACWKKKKRREKKMSIRSNCPCDLDGVCPYESESWGSCEYWCGSEEPQDEPDEWFYDDDEPESL
jgi:hypothetical protein